jgi:DNA-binding response OmpR family regulator/predicted regulator of Ras-like GTPase activity (Roadblock/LC7/MglB family)
MADVSRVFVVESEEEINRSVVNSLRKDGYFVQGVTSGADAMRILWSEEYDVVICDVRMPGANGFELLQWLRAYRPNTRLIAVGGPDTAAIRMQVLEGGAASYLEKPLDFSLLKEELRRLLQRTGFSASLDSFDLLHVIQIINMSRKTIALLVNTGLEEQGILGFQNGELIWAEYGTLRGEEAFFALAAHKNGTVVHQPWSGRVRSNVTQPLSRLILQALQYRSKYAHAQGLTGEREAVNAPLLTDEEYDDRPFVVLAESSSPAMPEVGAEIKRQEPARPGAAAASKEWWEKTGSMVALNNGAGKTFPIDMSTPLAPEMGTAGSDNNMFASTVMPSQPVQKAPMQPPNDLPEWLTDQPAPLTEQPTTTMPVVRPSSLTDSARVPVTPLPGPASSPGWQPPRALGTTAPAPPAPPGDGLQVTGARLPSISSDSMRLPRVQKRSFNYTALVSALQTLGYSIPGFIAAAVIGMDGQPIAQVAIDDLDISKMCKLFSQTLKSALQLLDGDAGKYEDMVITSAQRRILMRAISNDAFQVLITTREADPLASLEVMANVEGAISAALR